MSVFNNEPDGDCLDMATANFRLSCADMYFGDKCFDKINRIYRIGLEIMLILSEEIQRMKGGVVQVDGIFLLFSFAFGRRKCYYSIRFKESKSWSIEVVLLIELRR